jgi:hypothetical protein
MTRVNTEAIRIHQERQRLVERIGCVLRKLSLAEKHPGRVDLFLEMACRLGRLEFSPSDSFGFILTNVVRLARGRMTPLDTLCLCQIVKTMVMYLNLYVTLGETQDLRSCIHYVEWLEMYAQAPDTYAVVGNERHGWYLYPLKGVPGEVPNPPEWLQENEGETI